MIGAQPPSGSSPTTSDLTALGWVRRDDPPSRWSVDAAKAATWTVARLWSTSGVLASLPLPRGTQRVIVSVDGDAVVHAAEGSIPLSPRQLLIVDGASPISTESGGLWARYEVQLRSSVLTQLTFARHFATALDLKAGQYQVISAMANTISMSPDIAQSKGAGFFLEALSGMIAAALIDASGTLPGLSPSQSDIFRRASEVIDLRHGEDTFTVASLASALSVSERYLRRIYVAAGNTPRMAIEARRASTAAALLDSVPSPGTKTLSEIARRSGFSSVRQMQEAFVRQRSG